jgi:4-hydroxybenzoate polyprenyltransferase
MRLLPYAQLLRLPNVFTAFADILLGTLAAGTLMHRPLAAAFLLLASGCLYCSGMVWNDFFDFEIDRKERPFRPLPSGKISRSTARRIGLGLIAAGLGFAMVAGLGAEGWDSKPVITASALVAAILVYDIWLKHTPIGPVAMGACRFLNVLMATSLADASILPSGHRVHLALVVGGYIVGVTWFARGEAGRSLPAHLRGAAAVMLGAMLLALALPARQAEGTVTMAYPYLLVAFGFLVGIPITKAISRPDSQSVQAAIKRCILGLVVLDAILATAYVGLAGLAIILVLPPALVLGRRVYST